MIICNVATKDLSAFTGGSLTMLALTLCITIALIVSTRLAFRRTKTDRQEIMRFQTTIGNITYVAMPIMLIFGKEMLVFNFVLIGTVQDLFIWL